jgi:protein TonB
VLFRSPEPPPPEPSAPPPSVDDVFGEEPAPAAEVLAAQGATGGPAMDLGAAGGRAGGRAGGTGEGVGPGGGTGAGSGGPSDADRRRARRAYVRSLEGLLGGRVRYPRAAARERLEGRAELCLRIGDDGRVLGSRVCSSSGHDLLDDAALTAAQALERVPAPPALAAWAPSDEVHAGIQFRVQ